MNYIIDFEKSGGIVPVIVQDANTKDVLTLAYSNKESLELAKKTGKSWGQNSHHKHT